MIRNFLQRLMYGRYGSDQLNISLLILFWLFWLVDLLVANRVVSLVLNILAWVAILFAIFRMMSRNYGRRHQENEAFLRLAGPVLSLFRRKFTQLRDRDHAYFKCPTCSTTLRVPRGKGKISITCRNCGTVFQEKS